MTLADRSGLRQETIEAIRSVFRNCSDVESVILYGSRAVGTFKPGSDIDLTIRGEVSLSQLLCLEELLDALLLPYKIDLSIQSKIDNPQLIEHINRVGIAFYERD